MQAVSYGEGGMVDKDVIQPTGVRIFRTYRYPWFGKKVPITDLYGLPWSMAILIALQLLLVQCSRFRQLKKHAELPGPNLATSCFKKGQILKNKKWPNKVRFPKKI